jgi:nitrate reductase delta subunit
MDRLLELFADILDYPGADLAEKVRECREAAAARGHHADGLEGFGESVRTLPPEKLEEIYTTTFDLTPNATPYVGYHLFGDGYQRSAFLLELQKRYRAHDHPTGNELADHICVILRYLSRCDDPSERQELVEEAVVPALASMIEKTANAGQSGPTPYRMALGALRGVLKGE